jgi:hypothetical protein
MDKKKVAKRKATHWGKNEEMNKERLESSSEIAIKMKKGMYWALGATSATASHWQD